MELDGRPGLVHHELQVAGDGTLHRGEVPGRPIPAQAGEPHALGAEKLVGVGQVGAYQLCARVVVHQAGERTLEHAEVLLTLSGLVDVDDGIDVLHGRGYGAQVNMHLLVIPFAVTGPIVTAVRCVAQGQAGGTVVQHIDCRSIRAAEDEGGVGVEVVLRLTLVHIPAQAEHCSDDGVLALEGDGVALHHDGGRHCSFSLSKESEPNFQDFWVRRIEFARGLGRERPPPIPRWLILYQKLKKSQ